MPVHHPAHAAVPKQREPEPGAPPRCLIGWRRGVRIGNRALIGVAIAVLAAGYLYYSGRHPGGIATDEGGVGLGPLILGGVGLAFGLGNLVIKPQLGTTARLWASSLWFTALCLACVAGIWLLVFQDAGLRAIPGVEVSTPGQAERYLDRTLGPARFAGLPRVATGVYVQSVQFLDANDVKVSGYLWQRYGRDVPAGLTRGVLLPEAGDAYTTRQIYREADSRTGGHTVGWYFTATLRQRFDYQHYPLDFQSVRLRVWSADMNRAAVLVPDFASYPPWRLGGRYGLDPDLVNAGWRTRYTTFSYATNHYTASFGLARDADARRFPELSFDVGMARDFADPLVVRLLPVLFIVLLIFASLFVVTMQPKKRGVSGFSTFSVIGFAASMLMVITVQHASLRASLGESGLVYLEYFYLVVYAMILLVALNAVLMPSRFADRYFDWRGNLLPRLLYWPTFIGLVLAATLCSFCG